MVSGTNDGFQGFPLQFGRRVFGNADDAQIALRAVANLKAVGVDQRNGSSWGYENPTLINVANHAARGMDLCEHAGDI